VTVKIYVEGGAKDNKDVSVRCKRGFSDYCSKLSPAGRLPQVVACGSRSEAFKRFKTAATNVKHGDQCALLVDSEGPLRPGISPTHHLAAQERWSFQGLPSDQVFLMVQAMEAWFFADRQALADYYRDGFRPNALRGSDRDIESIAKNDLEQSLRDASVATTKGPYRKARHGFDLLSEIDPNKVEAASAQAASLHAFLRSI
jgi:hypothetical protein